jgi:hypothetical protein
MRAKEFIVEQKELPPEQSGPMQNTYVMPGLTAQDPYKTYRFGVAMARARSDKATDGVNDFRPNWSAETAFGEQAVIVGFNSDVDPVIDQALAMTKTPGGKKLVSTPKSEEPATVSTKSPIKGFKGYPR